MKNFAVASMYRPVLLAVLLLVGARAHGQTTWDFETGDLRGWTQTGDAFGSRLRQSQPTLGNNVAVRRPGIAINQQGNYWIGTYENRPGLQPIRWDLLRETPPVALLRLTLS